MFKFNFSVRAYHTARRYGLPHFEEWNTIPDEIMREICRNAADSILANKRSCNVAIELYRAAGLGVYNIDQTLLEMGWIVDFNKLRRDCNKFDQRLHESLN